MRLGDPVARLVERRSAPTTNATTRLPHSSSGTPTTSASSMAGCSRSRAATAGRGTFTPPLTTTSSIRPSTCSRPSSSSRPASEVRNQPSTSDLGRQRRVAVVPLEQGRPADPDPAAGADRERDAVQRVAVVDAAARGLGRAVRRDHVHARRPRPARAAPGRSGRRRAARCGRRAARRASRVVEQPVQLGRHQRHEPGVPRRPRPRPSRAPRAAAARGRRPASGRSPAPPRRTTPAAPAATARAAQPARRRRHRREHGAGARAPPASARRSSPRSRRRIGSGSPAAASHPPSAATTSRVVPVTGRRKLTRRTLVVVGRMPAMPPRTPRWLASLSPTLPSPGSSRSSRSSSRSARASSSPAARSSSPRSSACRASQVGLGLTVGEGASFLFAVPLGKLADRIGPKRMWASAAFGAAGLYAVWPFVDDVRDVPRDDGRAPDLRHRRPLRPRGVHARRLPPRGAGAVPRVHAGGPQHRLHDRRADRRRGAGLQQRRHHPRGPAVHRVRAAAQRLLHHPPARRAARQGARRGGRAAQPGRAAEPRLPVADDLRRRARHQPGAAQHRDPAVAGRGDRRPARAARLAVRHQHGAGRAAPGRGRARRELRRPRRCARPGSPPPSSCCPA